MPVVLEIDDYDLTDFVEVARNFGQNRYGYAVTPNIDHVIRYYDDPGFRVAYADANYVLLDSRFLANLLRFTHGLVLRVCTGSDLTARLFAGGMSPDDVIVIVGGETEDVARLAAMYELKDIRHLNPPMGFIRDPKLVESTLQFIENQTPFRYCLLGVGAPQQEVLAHRLKLRAKARGLVLCVGGSINFLTGRERRAPLWLQNAGFEWMFRLAQDPARLARRYLIRGPRVFGLLRKMKLIARRATSVGV